MFKRLVATSRAPQVMVLSMLRSFGKIGPQIDQIWAWQSRGGQPESGTPSKVRSRALVLVNCYLEIKFHKIIRVEPIFEIARTCYFQNLGVGIASSASIANWLSIFSYGQGEICTNNMSRGKYWVHTPNVVRVATSGKCGSKYQTLNGRRLLGHNNLGGCFAPLSPMPNLWAI